ncbi:MAG: energy-coupling factor ABC transporter ATP-binding protein [Gammaproteobacteria bacterium]
MNDVQIRYTELGKSFARRRLLENLALSLRSGSAVLLSGENGAGKTTLLRILAGLEKPAHCLVDFGAGKTAWQDCRKILLRRVMYLHQAPYMFDGSVSRNLELALPRGLSKSRRREKIRRALEWARISALAEARAKTLSGGEKQRVSLARAWLRQSKILLLDEPIANMDRESQLRTVALLQRLKGARVALVIASHNHEVFDALIDRQLLLDGGKLHAAPAQPLPHNVMRFDAGKAQRKLAAKGPR